MTWEQILSRVRAEFAGRRVVIKESIPPVLNPCGSGYTELNIIDGLLNLSCFIDPRITNDQKIVVLFHEAGHAHFLMMDEATTITWAQKKMPSALAKQFWIDSELAAFMRQATECLILAQQQFRNPLQIFVMCLNKNMPSEMPISVVIDMFKKEPIWDECVEMIKQ